MYGGTWPMRGTCLVLIALSLSTEAAFAEEIKLRCDPTGEGAPTILLIDTTKKVVQLGTDPNKVSFYNHAYQIDHYAREEHEDEVSCKFNMIEYVIISDIEVKFGTKAESYNLNPCGHYSPPSPLTTSNYECAPGKCFYRDTSSYTINPSTGYLTGESQNYGYFNSSSYHCQKFIGNVF
jgi:hypothetical protein